MRKRHKSMGNYESVQLVDIFYVDSLYSQKHPHMIHRHMDALELLYIASDSGNYIVGDYEYVVNAGDIVVCNAGISHGEDPFQQHTIQTYCLVFAGVALPKLPPCHLISANSRPVLSLGKRNVIVANLIPSLYKMFHANDKNYDICLHFALGIMLMTYQMIIERYQSLTSTSIKQEKLVHSIMDYINQHYSEQLNLKKISDSVYISETYLSHLFKRTAGLSPMQYLMQRRIGEAQSQLAETNLPIAEIADSLGFSSDAHFSKMFKKYVGTTPKEYRQHFSKRYQVI